MERYWKAHSTAPTAPTAPTESTENIMQPNDESILSEFDRHCLALLSSQAEDKGWQQRCANI
jgi:hypothetical protein